MCEGFRSAAKMVRYLRNSPCVAGWRAPEVVSIWAERPEATLQFRTKAAAGAKMHLILRLACLERSSHRLRIKSASGSEVSVSLRGRSDTFATLSCEVDQTVS